MAIISNVDQIHRLAANGYPASSVVSGGVNGVVTSISMCTTQSPSHHQAPPPPPQATVATMSPLIAYGPTSVVYVPVASFAPAPPQAGGPPAPTTPQPRMVVGQGALNGGGGVCEIPPPETQMSQLIVSNSLHPHQINQGNSINSHLVAKLNHNKNNHVQSTGKNNEALQFLSKGGQVIVRMRGLPYDCTSEKVVS